MQRKSRLEYIKERDWLTRFSYAWGPLCRWPGATIEHVEKRVRDDLARLAPHVQKSERGDGTL